MTPIFVTKADLQLVPLALALTPDVSPPDSVRGSDADQHSQ